MGAQCLTRCVFDSVRVWPTWKGPLELHEGQRCGLISASPFMAKGPITLLRGGQRTAAPGSEANRMQGTEPAAASTEGRGRRAVALRKLNPESG